MHDEVFKSKLGSLDAFLGPSDKVSSQIRLYTKEELQKHYEAVVNVSGDKPVLVPNYKEGYGGFTVLPNGLRGFRSEAMGTTVRLHKEAAVESIRDVLESFHAEVMPDKPKTIENLYFLYELLKEPR